MATFHVLCRTFAAVACLLFIAPVTQSSGAELAQTSGGSAVLPGPEADALSEAGAGAHRADAPPDACRQCGGLPYFPPSTLAVPPEQSSSADQGEGDTPQPAPSDPPHDSGVERRGHCGV